MIETETKMGLFNSKFYKKFMMGVEKRRNNLITKLLKLKNSGANIVAIGAAAKGNTFLNYHKLDNSIINYVTDSSLLKKGKFTPLSRIPIVDDKIISKLQNVHVLILSWNISENLINKLKTINKDIVIIK